MLHKPSFCFSFTAEVEDGPHHDQPVPAAGEMLHLLILNSFIWSYGILFLILIVFLSQVSEAIDNHEGLFCAELLSFKHPHVANPRLQVSCRLHRCCEDYCVLGCGLIGVCAFQLANPEEKCQQLLEPPYDEMVAAHLR